MRKHKYFAGAAILLVAIAAAASDLDSLTRGSKPSASGQPLCSSSSSTAAWKTPVQCGLAISSNSPTGVQPLCGYPDAGAAYGTPLTCGLATSNNAPNTAGNELCVYPDAGASFDTPANCHPSGYTVPTVTTTASLVIGAGNPGIANSKTATIVLSGSLAAQTCSNTCVALNGGQGYPATSCLPQAGIITDGYMDGAANACIHACNITSAAIPLSTNCYVREFQ